MRLNRIDYRGWKILIFPQNTFTCYTPADEPISSDYRHQSVEMALAAAKTFIDRTILREELQNILDDWLEAGRIQAGEYDQVDQIIGAIVRANFLDHFESAQTPLPQSPETHPDPSP